MKIKLGQCWVARLSKSEIAVRIDDYEPKGGWVARSLSHGRRVWVRNADQLIHRCDENGIHLVADETVPNRRQRAAGPQNELPLDDVNRKDGRSASDPCLSTERNNQMERKLQPPAVAHSLPTTLLDAAILVLRDNRKSMSTKEIINAVQEKGLWNPTGKTPWLTLHTAMSREIETKGTASRFQKAKERGKFTLR